MRDGPGGLGPPGAGRGGRPARIQQTKTTTDMRLKALVMALLLAVCTAPAQAQCGIKNNAFKSGEFLYYDLFFNWKFIWVKVGTASMSTVMSRYGGQPAYRASLITRSNNKLDKFFTLRDTLLSYCASDLSPLYFRKGAREGHRYYVDEIWYTYPKGNCHMKQHRIEDDGRHVWKQSEYQDCVYDMMSIFLRARNFDASQYKVGQNIPMPVSDAKRLSHSWLKYRGKETYKMEGNNIEYRCLVFSFIEREDGENKELLRFYVTDDANHIPVRLDMFLSFGSAKAFLRGYKGVKNPVTSKLN